ncbi:MAG: cytochrome C oxidase subunit II [Alphaproteobacteria bacterium]|nr:cytochrome C oxidase subunit II [Alphaproteobacteria bacterium]
MIDFLVPRGSTFAGEIDNLFLIITAVVGFWFVLTMGMFLYMMVAYRRREGVHAEYITGKEPELKRWITIPHGIIILCDVVLIVGAVRVWYMVKQDRPEKGDEVRIVAQQWAWTFYHAGPDGELGTPDDIAVVDELHVTVDTVYHFSLESRDVLHSFSVPTFRLKQDVIPGRKITGWFEPTRLGEYDIQCAEMCGIAHGVMGARLFVETEAEHAAWIERMTAMAAK